MFYRSFLAVMPGDLCASWRRPIGAERLSSAWLLTFALAHWRWPALALFGGGRRVRLWLPRKRKWPSFVAQPPCDEPAAMAAIDWMPRA